MSRDETFGDGVEERAILRALADLEAGGADREPPADPAERALLREYTEVLGLLPWALEPVAPPPGAERRLLERVRREGVRGPARPAEGAAGGGPRAAPPPTPTPRWRRWAAPVAAVLAVVLLGLSASLLYQVERQRRTIAELSSRLADLSERVGAVDDVGAELAGLRDRLALVTEPRVEICALRAMSDDPSLASARGVLYVSGDHERWFLTLAGLDPAPDGLYQLWFESPEGPVSAGVLEVGREGRLELGSDWMPEGAAAVFVTLERRAPAEEPTGPMVLWGDEAMTLL